LIGCVYIKQYLKEIAPWGTPASIGVKFDITEPTFVAKIDFQDMT